MVVPEDRLHFGEVWEDKKFVWELPIENRQEHEVTVKDFVTTCTCTTVEPRSLTIPAGESRALHLTLDLTAERSKLPESEWRDFEVWVRPVLDKSNQRQAGEDVWKVRGRVRTAIRFEQTVLDFGRHSEAAQPLSPQKVLVTSFVPLQSLTAFANSDKVRVQVVSDPAAPGRQYELTVSVLELPTGPIQYQIDVFPRLGDGTSVVGKSLPVSGRIVSDIQASPSEATFGARSVGETAEELLTLQSLTNRRFEVTSVKAEGDGLAVERLPVESGGSPTFRVKQSIAKAGEQHGRVVFGVRTAEGKDSEFVVSVSYLGLGELKD